MRICFIAFLIVNSILGQTYLKTSFGVNLYIPPCFKGEQTTDITEGKFECLDYNYPITITVISNSKAKKALPLISKYFSQNKFPEDFLDGFLNPFTNKNHDLIGCKIVDYYISNENAFFLIDISYFDKKSFAYILLQQPNNTEFWNSIKLQGSNPNIFRCLFKNILMNNKSIPRDMLDQGVEIANDKCNIEVKLINQIISEFPTNFFNKTHCNSRSLNYLTTEGMTQVVIEYYDDDKEQVDSLTSLIINKTRNTNRFKMTIVDRILYQFKTTDKSYFIGIIIGSIIGVFIWVYLFSLLFTKLKLSLNASIVCAYLLMYGIKTIVFIKSGFEELNDFTFFLISFILFIPIRNFLKKKSKQLLKKTAEDNKTNNKSLQS